MNFRLTNLTKPKKKLKNTTKYHNIFYFQQTSLIFYYFIFYVYNIFTTKFKWQIATGFKLEPPL